MMIHPRLRLGALTLIAFAAWSVAAQEPTPVLSETERQAIVQAARSLTAEGLAEAVRKAEAGDLDAQVLVAQAYFLGNSPHRDPLRAVPFLEQAAARGHPLAQNALGVCYLRGEGVNTDEALAVLWIRKAVNQGLAQAMYVLGLMYATGDGVTRDVTEALLLWRAAAEQGNSWGQTELGKAYEVGQLVPQDAKAAAEWYRKAALQGNPEAQTLLAFMYAGGTGVQRDMTEAARLFLAAAEQGHEVAQFNLAIAYVRGDGVPKSTEHAAVWLQRASDRAYAPATCTLGDMYWSGAVGNRAIRAARSLTLYEKCAAQGFAAGAVTLGDIHVGERNYRAACTWLAIAREIEKTPAWQEQWALLRPHEAKEVRIRLPKLLSEVRKKLKPQQMSDCEAEAARWLQAQGIVKD